MRLGMSQVEKKGIAAVPVDKINGAFSKPGGKVRLMCRGDRINFHLSISPEVQRKLPPELRILRMLCPHVVGIHDADSLIKSAVLRRSEEHTSELQSRGQLVCRLLLEQ